MQRRWIGHDVTLLKQCLFFCDSAVRHKVGGLLQQKNFTLAKLVLNNLRMQLKQSWQSLIV